MLPPFFMGFIMYDVTCPHCGEVQDTTDWIELGGSDGSDFDVTCRYCDEVFEVVTSISVSYTVVGY